MVRRFVGYKEAIEGGEFTPEELEAAQACGYINRFRQGLFEVIRELEADLPEGWRLTYGNAVHDRNPPVPDIPAAENEPILMGFVKVHSGDPSYPIWLWKRKNVPGRPATYGEKMTLFSLNLPEPMIEWLKSQPGGAAETVRRLIEAERAKA